MLINLTNLNGGNAETLYALIEAGEDIRLIARGYNANLGGWYHRYTVGEDREICVGVWEFVTEES